MKPFLNRLFAFSIPLILIVGGLFVYAEVRLYSSLSTFRMKAKHLEENKEKIDVLVLGSSHHQSAINPEYMSDFCVSNVASGGQNIEIDSSFLKAKINELKHLKAVIFELSYHTLEHGSYNNTYYRNSLYLRYYDINLFGRRLSPIDYSIYFSNPPLYNAYLNPFREPIIVNKFGYITEIPENDESNHFAGLDFNHEKIMADTNNLFITRHKSEDTVAYLYNTGVFRRMVKTCVLNNIEPIVVMPPVYENYYQSYLPAKEKRRRSFLVQLVNEFPMVKVLDEEREPYLVTSDFQNEDHLNPTGAAKFSRRLNDSLKTLFSL